MIGVKRNLKVANKRAGTNSGFHERRNEQPTTLCASLETCRSKSTNDGKFTGRIEKRTNTQSPDIHPDYTDLAGWCLAR